MTRVVSNFFQYILYRVIEINSVAIGWSIVNASIFLLKVLDYPMSFIWPLT